MRSKFSLFGLLAVMLMLFLVADASAFGRRCRGCQPNCQAGSCYSAAPSCHSYSVPYTCPMTGASSCGTAFATCPPAGCPVRYTTPGCSGGACSPAGVPVNYGFQFGCPNGRCR